MCNSFIQSTHNIWVLPIPSCLEPSAQFSHHKYKHEKTLFFHLQIPTACSLWNVPAFFFMMSLEDSFYILSSCWFCLEQISKPVMSYSFEVSQVHFCATYRSVIARATGSLLWITEKTLFTNSSTLRIFSRCFSLCWVTFSTHNLRKLFLSEDTSLSLLSCLII